MSKINDWIYVDEALPQDFDRCYIAVHTQFGYDTVLEDCYYRDGRWHDGGSDMQLPLRMQIYAWMYQQSKPVPPEYKGEV